MSLVLGGRREVRLAGSGRERNKDRAVAGESTATQVPPPSLARTRGPRGGKKNVRGKLLGGERALEPKKARGGTRA